MEELKVRPLTDFGSPTEIIREFGTKENYLIALNDLENKLYK
jgi:type I restriction enzyme R subunit